MTARQVTAGVVSTYAQPDRTNALHLEQRQRQAQGVFKQLGAVIQQKREHDFEDVTEAEQARVQAKSISLSYTADAATADLLRKPEFAKLTPEEFMETEEYKSILATFDTVDNPVAAEKLKAKYAEDMMAKHGAAHEENKRNELNTEAAHSQQGAAHYGAEEQLRMFALHEKAGADRAYLLQNLIMAGGTVSVKQLKELRDGGSWTPEETALFDKTIESAKKQYNMEANVAYKYANKIQDRSRREAALIGVLEKYGADLSEDKVSTLTAELMVLQEELLTEEWASRNFGLYSIQEMADGKGMPEGMRRLPREDLKRLRDSKVREALQNGDLHTVVQLAAVPGDPPEALQQFFNQSFGSLASIDPTKEADVQRLNRAITYANAVKDNLGWPMLKQMMGESEYAAFVDIAQVGDFAPLEVAVEEARLVQQLEANGKMPKPEGFDKARRSVVDKLASGGSQYSWYDPRRWLADSPMSRASIESTLAPHFRRWQALQLSEEEMTARAQKIMEGSAWGGYLNGGVLGAHLEQLTIGENGNPYGDKTGEDLLEDFRSGYLEQLKADNPDLEELTLVIGANPNVIFLQDKGGLTIPNSMISAQFIKDWVQEHVPTKKQEVLNEREGSSDKASGNTSYWSGW